MISVKIETYLDTVVGKASPLHLTFRVILYVLREHEKNQNSVN